MLTNIFALAAIIIKIFRIILANMFITLWLLQLTKVCTTLLHQEECYMALAFTVGEKLSKICLGNKRIGGAIYHSNMQ